MHVGVAWDYYDGNQDQVLQKTYKKNPVFQFYFHQFVVFIVDS